MSIFTSADMENDMENGIPPPPYMEKSANNTAKPEKRMHPSEPFLLAMHLVLFSVFAWFMMSPFKAAVIAAQERAPNVYNLIYDHAPLNSTLNSTAAQLVNLQGQLAARMELHHSVMSTDLDNFTAALANITSEIDESVEHLQLIHNLIILGAGHSYMDWEQAASLLVDVKTQLQDPAISKDLRSKVEAIAEMASIMNTEMKNMELFMKDMEVRITIFLEQADSIIVAAEQKAHDADEKPDVLSENGGFLQQPLRASLSVGGGGGILYEKPSEALQWSWDMYKDGQVQSQVGEFTPLQRRLVESFLTKQNITLTHSTQPVILRYGIGLPDTYPTLESLLGITATHSIMLEIISSSDFVLDEAGGKYTCDITAIFKQEGRELIGVQKVACYGEGDEGKDVVRERREQV